MMKRKRIITTISLLLLFGVLTFCTWYSVKAIAEYNKWYESLSESEKLEYEKKKEAEYEARIERYDVVSVYIYAKQNTTNFGAITSTDVCYAFTYDANGSLKSVEDFKHLEYGLTKVTLGDKDTYIINNNGETTRILQLTKATLSKLTGG